MNRNVIVYPRTKPPMRLDNVSRIELLDDRIVIVRPDGPVVFQANDIITFEGR